MTEINVKADDVMVTAKILKKEELIKAMNEKANEMGSSINQEKTEYLEINAKRNHINRNRQLKMGQHNFEIEQTLSFLGSLINYSNVNSEEIWTRIKKGNILLYG
jgi:hypothetical protein